MYRMRIVIQGAVQGVGFRPYIYGLAYRYQLTGWIKNDGQGVVIEVEGASSNIESFRSAIVDEKPEHAVIDQIETSFCDLSGDAQFCILESDANPTTKTVLMQPDLAVCDACVRELFDPRDRRYRYPFINCTQCGPRYSIIQGLPYDRHRTTMKRFVFCEPCHREYEDPRNRRFHAQPNACATCGPKLTMCDARGLMLAQNDEALRLAISMLQHGQILAVKGLSGFHLMVNAIDHDAVYRLRLRKCRPHKAFAIMAPSISWIHNHCAPTDIESKLLLSAAAPIVILDHRCSTTTHHSTCDLAFHVAPNNPTLGVFLPYTPLHHLLLHDLGSAVVATSGNLAEEPICIDENHAVQKLSSIADAFLLHDRPIARRADDSVIRVVHRRPLFFRRARGYAPLPIRMAQPVEEPTIALGAHQKNCIALTFGASALLSPHLGDLDSDETQTAFDETIRDLATLYGVAPTKFVCDAHPDYGSTRWAETHAPSHRRVQHHYAHAASCLVDNQLTTPALCVVWDGTGYGTDHTIWGGEFLVLHPDRSYRAGSLRPFALLGGEHAIRDPKRLLISLLYQLYGDELLTLNARYDLIDISRRELQLLLRLLKQNINCISTSSMGRLLDACAVLLHVCDRVTFEGQAAMALEFAIGSTNSAESYACSLYENEQRDDCTIDMPHWILDWRPIMKQLLDDHRQRVSASVISTKLHNTLIESIVTMARHVGLPQVLLSGGCFQNRFLTERAIQRLNAAGFQGYWHKHVPPNDGGIALGQLAMTQLSC